MDNGPDNGRETEIIPVVRDLSEKVVISGRTKGHLVIEISLRAEQIEPFKQDLEELCNSYLNMN